MSAESQSGSRATSLPMETVFDFGMFDGSDTAYYLETGHKVVAIEANPALCAAASKKFAKYIESGQLVIENLAISNTPGTIDLHVCGQDLGSSSIHAGRLEERHTLGKYTVQTITYDGLVAKHGKPQLLKIDIEGADHECVLSLTHESAPPYISFEAHHDLEAMIDHCWNCGYRDFKIIHQNSFRCIQNQDSLIDRVKHKLIRMMGFSRPLMVVKEGRRFMLEHSAGPAPWHSDGRWHDRKAILKAWKAARRRGWYDVHAKTRTAAPVARLSAARAGLWWWAGQD